MASPITFSGLGSGLDTQAIISALMEVERIPINQLEARKTLEQKKLSLIGTLKGNVNTLRDKAKSLATSGEFLSFAALISDQSAATVSASATATAGAHTLVIQSLAASDRWAFNSVTDPAVDLATVDGQAVSFDYNGQSYSVAVNATTSSLTEIASAINNATSGKVKASVVQTSDLGTGTYELVIAGDQAGAAYRITNIASTIAGLTIDGTGPTGNTAGSANNLIVGSNAIAVIDGQTISRASNDFSNVIPGVTITALEADPLTTHSITIEGDKTAIKAKIKSFVDAYNELAKFIDKQSKYDSEEGPSGELFGDPILRSVMSMARNALFSQSSSQVASDTTGYGTLRMVGIELQSDGTLKTNDAKLDAKLDTDPNAFADLFVDTDGFDNGGAAPGTPGYYVDQSTDSGLMDDLVREIDRVVKSYQSTSGSFSKGIFDARTDTINANVKRYNDQIDAKQRRLDVYEQQLSARFASLESLMAQLQSQRFSLTGTTG
ncbi:MAG: flagellar filament capping protein FliD [Planctomycetes bacterium]|nr:flagellar filament capping protein FliD [Planctomycetota bacterium]